MRKNILVSSFPTLLHRPCPNVIEQPASRKQNINTARDSYGITGSAASERTHFRGLPSGSCNCFSLFPRLWEELFPLSYVCQRGKRYSQLAAFFSVLSNAPRRLSFKAQWSRWGKKQTNKKSASEVSRSLGQYVCFFYVLLRILQRWECEKVCSKQNCAEENVQGEV